MCVCVCVCVCVCFVPEDLVLWICIADKCKLFSSSSCIPKRASIKYKESILGIFTHGG